MKLHGSIKLAVLAAMLVGAAGFWSACNFEQVGPKEPTALKLADVLAELDNSRSQIEAEVAIQHLLEKTGVGIEVRGSQYGEYTLPDNFVTGLAQEHLLYLQSGKPAWTWGEMFEIEKLLSEDDWGRPVEFQEAMTRLQELATAAQSNPENPNQALLLALVAKGATVPAAIPLYEQAAMISPVQEFLFAVWASYEFDGPGSSQKSTDHTGKVKFTITQVVCDDDEVDKKIKTKHEEAYFSKAQKKCLETAKKTYEKMVKKCFKDFDDDEECPEIYSCLESARAWLLAAIQNCHDQGGGN